MTPFKLGIAGTAKNTGKTTATAAIIEELRINNKKFVLTSIGYDGEFIDTVTGLPKPKLWALPGDIIVTTKKCIDVSTAKFNILKETGIQIPLGEIVITSVTKAGLSVTAGPNKSHEVKKVSELLQDMYPEVIIFDGALNRIAPIGETDGFVLVTGASKSTKIDFLAEETKNIEKICNLKALSFSEGQILEKFQTATIFSKGYEAKEVFSTSSFFSEQSLKLENGDILYVPGIVSETFLKGLIKQAKDLKLNNLKLVFINPVKLLASNTPSVYGFLIEAFKSLNNEVNYVKSIHVLAVTVNPFYPKFKANSNRYTEEFIDAKTLKEEIQKNISLPVFDIVKDGGSELYKLLQNKIANTF